MHRVLWVAMLCGWMAAPLAAQDFSDLRAKVGDVVYVTESSGVQTTGKLTMMSASTLSMNGRTFMPGDVLRIERRGDPLWDGALIGLAVGAGVGTLLAKGECGVDLAAWQCTAQAAAWGALFGTFIDWQHSGRTLIFGMAAARTSSAVPVQRSSRRDSLAVSLAARVVW